MFEKPTDQFWAVCTVYLEARGEGQKGQEAVAAVIRNRTLEHTPTAPITSVVFAPYQFSCWNTADLNRLSLGNVDDEVWQSCISACIKVWARGYLDITDGANAYYNPKVSVPSWAHKDYETVKIGNHQFLRLPS